MTNWLTTYNNAGAVSLEDIPQIEYHELRAELVQMLKSEDNHLAHYFAVPFKESYFKMFVIVLCDSDKSINISSYKYDYYASESLESMVGECAEVHVFERDITERYGVKFENSPYARPLRFISGGYDKNSKIENYPFYKIGGEALHEVNVGPIHAGVIEPGAFRFICHGEKVLHLEIALGYQHRGIEKLILKASSGLKRNLLAETISGDSVAAHTACSVMTLEKLNSGFILDENLALERTAAIELERVAMHLADTGALCNDIGYQLGQVALEALRTLVINSSQLWCGNRFSKGMIRLAGANYTLDAKTKKGIIENLNDVRARVLEVIDNIKNTPSILARFEQCGILNFEQARDMGAVGMSARASGLRRDLRETHPYLGFEKHIQHKALIRAQGDVMARVMLRFREIIQSIDYCFDIFRLHDSSYIAPKPNYNLEFGADKLSLSLIEGFRGEIVHVAITGERGEIVDYRIKDASLHNWSALANVLRGEGISDFPICNKSFNLSYCGFDL
ncbi:MAG: NADH dehydrogenase subunit [Rikenellaceae bacterium]